jgi:hypothetical protein
MANRPYVVRQGETLVSIVAANGAGTPDAVWNDPDNAKLKKLRRDPAVLNPGDVLFLPEPKHTWLTASVGTTNPFTAKVTTQPVKLILGGANPLAGEPYVVQGLGDDIQGSTGGDGSLQVDVPLRLDSFLLVLPKRGVVHRILVGHLDPETESSGVGQRLSNLGYVSTLAPLLVPLGETVDAASDHHVRLFQLGNGIAPSGDADDATVDALRKAHGT